MPLAYDPPKPATATSNGVPRSLASLLLRQLLNLLLITFIAAPALIGTGAGALRLLFPITAAVLGAAFLLTGRLSQYVTFCIWLFLLTPGVRRLVDLQAGWDKVNIIMLAPYAAAGLSICALPAMIVRKHVPGAAGLLIVVGLATYGLIVACFSGRIFAGAYDYLRW